MKYGAFFQEYGAIHKELRRIRHNCAVLKQKPSDVLSLGFLCFYTITYTWFS